MLDHTRQVNPELIQVPKLAHLPTSIVLCARRDAPPSSPRLRLYSFAPHSDGFRRPQFYPSHRKLIYCSRTVPEIEKALAELKRLMAYRAEMGCPDEGFRGIGLSSRKNLCLHPDVSRERKGKTVDARCRDLTSAAACEKGRADPGSTPLCEFHEVRLQSLLLHPLPFLLSILTFIVRSFSEGPRNA